MSLHAGYHVLYAREESKTPRCAVAVRTAAWMIVRRMRFNRRRVRRPECGSCAAAGVEHLHPHHDRSRDCWQGRLQNIMEEGGDLPAICGGDCN